MGTLPRPSRRDVLQSSGALIFTLSLGDATGALGQTDIAAGKPPLLPTELDSWLAIDANGTVTVYFGKIDVGQGVDVAMGQIVAEELDVPFERVVVVQGDNLSTIDQGDASGSTAVSNAGPVLRVAAAEARKVLLEQAARKWNVAPDKLVVSDGAILVASDASKKTSYGELIGGRYFNTNLQWNNEFGNNLAITGSATVKSPDRYKVVGKSYPRYDIPGKVYATAPFITDVRVPGMLHGRMIRPAAAAAVPLSVDEASIRDISGTIVVRKGNLIGVVAEKEWDAVRAAQNLKVVWSEPGDTFPSSAEIHDHLRKTPAFRHQVVTDAGNVDDVFAKSAKVLEAEYEWPFQSHASMGPGCVLVDARAAGATVWTGSQKPHAAAQGVAKILNLPPDKVHSIWVYGSGSYGRNDAGDAAMDAAILSQAVGKPVRVQHMRHEATAWDPKSPPSVQHVRAALDSDGKITAFEFSSKGMSVSELRSGESDPDDTLAGQLIGLEPQGQHRFGQPDNGYEFANKRISWDTIPPLLAKASPLRTSNMRDPTGPHIQFASESFIDELAHAAGADPIAFRLRHLTAPRDIGVLTAVAEKVEWESGPSGTRRGKRGDILTGRGVAYSRRNATVMALVVDIELNPKTAKIWARKFTVAHDCGLIINPDTLRRVIEGNILYGLSRTFEEVTFDHLAVTSVDWLSYPILEMSDAPETIDIVLINHTDTTKSGGAGEGESRLVAAAVNNAIFEATGMRIRRVPLTPARVKAALA